MNDLMLAKKKDLVKQMPKKYSELKPLHIYGGELFINRKLIEIIIGDRSYMGQCFVDETRKAMYWRPMHRWYVMIGELGEAFSYDLLKDKLMRIVPSDVELNTFYENKMKKIMKKGKFHLHKTQEAYIELQELKGSGRG